ncbi:MAG: ABC transporter ATP-binding protein [Candidatus Hodarchaeales archaeon]|jgi:iron complex transport system ATP-binding protein
MEIQLENVSFQYEDVTILDRITFNAGKGQIIGILGPNGSGKTTLIRCIAGFLKLNEGSISINKKDVHQYKRKELAQILSVVPQISSLTAGFTVFETVLMGRYPHLGIYQREAEKDYKIVNSALERVGITHLVDRDTSELSGGEKQLVTIALGLAQEPQILCLDEPTLHLDINMQYKIMELSKEVCRTKQISVIVVLHDLALAAQYCDSLVILKNGQVRALGTPDEVINSEYILDTYGVNVIVGRDVSTGLKYIVPDFQSNAESKSVN